MATFRSRQRATLRRDPNSPSARVASKPPLETPADRRPRSDDTAPKKPFARRDTPPAGQTPRGDERKPFAKKPFERRDGDAPRGEERKPFVKKPFERRDGDAPRGEERKPFVKKPFERRDGDAPRGEERKPFVKKPFERRDGDAPRSEERKPFVKKPFERRDGDAPRGEERKPFVKKPFERRDGDAPRGEERKSFVKKPFERRDGDAPRSEERKSFVKKPFERRDGDAPRGEERKPFVKKPFEHRDPPQAEPELPRGPAPQINRSLIRRRDPDAAPAAAPAAAPDAAAPAPAPAVTPAEQARPARADVPAVPQERAERSMRRNQPTEATPPRRSGDGPYSAPARSGAPVELALFATCPRGLDEVLATELAALGAGDIVRNDGGVSFSGDDTLMMRANLESRVASRILLRLAQGPYRDERDINALAMQVDWPRHFDVTRSIKVKTDGVGARVKSLDFVSLTVKDAVCDRFRQVALGRPNVDTRNPDIRIHVFVAPDRATIYLDTSGDALFKRGWRQETGEAPLRENLAAGILLLSGYDGEQALLDPMCGSGTFLVEAANIALRRAPGLSRRFGFEKFSDFDARGWDAQLATAHARALPARPLPIHGSDNDPAMIAMAQANLERAGLADVAQLAVSDVLDTRPHADAGLIVSNPPYGVRMDELDTLAGLYPQLGDWLKKHFAGWTANLFTGDLRLAQLIRLAVKRRTPLYNGALECRLFSLPLVAGSARKDPA
jgi:putative N6-adenine-specific DNA methylase